MRKEKEGEGSNQDGKVRRWKTEKQKMRMIVREKKKVYWKKCCKENGEKDPKEVVRQAKDPCRIRKVMKSLQDAEHTLLNTDEEKAEALVRDNFVWNEEERSVYEEVEETRDRGGGQGSGQDNKES